MDSKKFLCEGKNNGREFNKIFMFLLIIFLFFSVSVYAQSNCICEKDSLITKTILEKGCSSTAGGKNCEIFELKNGNLLYYQFNCDSIWLTFENKQKNKKVLFSKETEAHAHSYRRAYELVREFDNSLLFSFHCSPICLYFLHDKQTGEALPSLPTTTLIFDGKDKEGTEVNFLIYFTDEKYQFLTIHNIASNKKYQVLIPDFKRELVYPEMQITYSKIINNSVELYYDKKSIKINFEKYN